MDIGAFFDGDVGAKTWLFENVCADKEPESKNMLPSFLTHIDFRNRIEALEFVTINYRVFGGL